MEEGFIFTDGFFIYPVSEYFDWFWEVSYEKKESFDGNCDEILQIIEDFGEVKMNFKG
jgi:hypothetical protein